MRLELGALAPNLQVLDLSCARIAKVADLHAMLAALPSLRVLLFSGDSDVGGNLATLVRDGYYFSGMAEHPSLEYVRLQPDSDAEEDVQGLLAHCPALRVLDCTQYRVYQPGFERMAGGERLTHIFGTPDVMFEVVIGEHAIDRQDVINVLDGRDAINVFGG